MTNDPARLVGRSLTISPVAPWATVTRDGVRTLTYYGQPAAHYCRASNGQWRGVTHQGRLLYAAREGHLRQKLKEAHA